MSDAAIGLAELTGAERKRLGSSHPQIRRGDSALVIAGSGPMIAAIQDFARGLAWQTTQSDRLLDLLTADLEQGVLSEPRVLQLRRQAEARQQFLNEFPTLGSRQVAELGGSTARNTAALASRWKAAGKVFALPLRGADRFPAFQFGEDGRPLPVIGQLIEVFGPDKPWAIALWLASHSGWLDGARPVDLLQRRPEAVLAAARHAVEPPSV